MFVYVGTYSRNGSKGIYVYDFDLSSGHLAFTGHTTDVPNPTFLALHPTGGFLYAVNEVGEMNGEPGGGISSFAIDEETGALTLLNQQSTRGGGPCHVSVDATGRLAVVANYGGGSIAALPIEGDGSLSEASSFFQHVGSSINAKRQEKPHAHSVTFNPAGDVVLAADLGLDRLKAYRVNDNSSALVPQESADTTIHPGAGPRHMAWHPTLNFAYIINELDCTISTLAHDAEKNSLSEWHSVPTLPESFSGNNTCADIHIEPQGRFLYGSNRGHDSIAIFSIDGSQHLGRLTPIGHESTQGSNPRNFVISPDGKYLLAANQDSHNIVVFRIDAETGMIAPTGQSVEVPSPVCVKFRLD
jgi:6-phosphogluconolactonase